MAVAVFFQIVQKILPIQNKGLPLLSIKHRKSMLKGFQHIQRRSSFGFFLSVTLAANRLENRNNTNQ